VSGIAALSMVVGALILGGDEDIDDDHGGNLNMPAVLLDTAADAAAAASVTVTGSIILKLGATSGWTRRSPGWCKQSSPITRSTSCEESP
jgi:hypothetical protein